MAKTDNLTDFLTGVAGAIRTKKGTTALINPQDFESEIGSIDTAKPEQTKTLTVTENGTQTVKPDTGKVLSGVTVTTNVPATPTEEKTVDLAMASGNQVVTPASGKHLTKVTITKPATLAADNIKSGVNIGGVTGTLSPAKAEQAKTVDLAMASGNQVVSPDSGKVLSSVTITKPTTLVASNIKKGVDIGGVVGTMEAGGGSSNKLVKVVDGTITELTAEDLAGATQLRDYAFYRYSSLASITIPDGVTALGRYALNDCSSLTSVTIGNDVTRIGDSAFANCTKLASITIPDGVTALGGYAFNGCSSLTSITIPDKVTYINNFTFHIGSSTNKAVITMKPTTPPYISNNSFNKNYLEKIIVPKGTGATYKAATNWSALADYIQEATT